VVLSAGTLVLVTSLVIALHGAALEGPADPTSGYEARPEWYARPLYQLRMLFEGPLQIIATMVIPGIATGFLVALPFLDRGPSREPRTRWPLLSAVLAGLALASGLGAFSLLKDRHDQGYQRHRAQVRQQASLARALAVPGVPPEGGTAVYRNDPAFAARELYDEHCLSCHTLTRQGGGEGPDLGDYNSRAWLTGFLHDPQGPLYMGPAKKPAKGGMKPVQASPQEIAALVEFVHSQSGAPDVDTTLAKAGASLFSDKDCDSCHELAPGQAGDAPNLLHRGTLAYVVATIEDPSRPTLYGERSKMPKYAGKLTPAQIESLARLVLDQRKR
jgi:ubiquinol-cytochrome c reductase cytochrome b subunit